MATAAEATAEVRRVWDSAILGVCLVTKFYSDDPWTSAAELAGATGFSEDTTRRRLEALARIGRVRVGQRGRVRVYKAQRDWAARTLQVVKSLAEAAKCG